MRCIIFVERVISAIVLQKLFSELLLKLGGWKTKYTTGRAFVLYMEDIYFCAILCFRNSVFLYVIFNLDGLYLVGVALYDIWNMMLEGKVFGWLIMKWVLLIMDLDYN